jgi:hypothetical protein
MALIRVSVTASHNLSSNSVTQTINGKPTFK